MKKNFVFILGLGVIFMARSQVGINTTNPRSTLDINGDLTIRNELKVGGTTGTAGVPGLNNYLLVSQGSGAAPQWKASKVGFYEAGEYRIMESRFTTDQVGINFGNLSIGDGVATSTTGETLTQTNPKWTEITGLATSFNINNADNRVNLSFQTGVEMSDIGNNDSQFVRFACGIFVDNNLVSLRSDQINGIYGKGNKNQSIFTLNYIIQNLPVGPHVAKVGCRRITSSSSGYHFAIGRTTTDGTQVANNFMLNSILKFNVNEKVIVNN
ncbi:hypothetical protein V2E39_08195 [Chryseobacterium arthrosphaerae]|uniref:Uncharacterized protein n=2 Tax=Chryseobacterium arthrosphaerae TaxID=651561 RepID=A0A1B8ZSL6_9FLAO|nr:hypothetical protein [Chryseobacterium arthrosphaerae]MDG4651132.1 hypothetical protein [Chryseobacterium arthrosphaerae]OCA74595.1 hypothetical protein BBI00_09745 [Chryseobacterium arthrosphaerae]